ncbi:uncharacterized protein B0T23DRAFT_386013 [Neurospora hispaniola]|uniref:Uncharacterized protein n=1 Tax=Neurospora hispaniola TaxID=588809 RepID=A0AAJ0I187_9PEZI|nr:hypothetical protein B0T23DRAFT_386013 [Neurospora hispaniola]
MARFGIFACLHFVVVFVIHSKLFLHLSSVLLLEVSRAIPDLWSKLGYSVMVLSTLPTDRTQNDNKRWWLTRISRLPSLCPSIDGLQAQTRWRARHPCFSLTIPAYLFIKHPRHS